MRYQKGLLLLAIFLLVQLLAFSQVSIHMEQADFNKGLGYRSIEEYDSTNGFSILEDDVTVAASLDKIVFGYHPYWGGSNYLNYQWHLLSDLCYFSYDVNPETGEPNSIYDWLTSPAIDSAFANDVRVHLCVTLFSGQGIFFNNQQSRQTLTNNLINLVSQRGAHGVSLDFEAVPASQGANMLSYIAEFATAFHDSLPEGILSIAMPSVDWSGIFDISTLNQYIDLYMIMGYDYYWNGSGQAGPVDPHYSMTSGDNDKGARTISYYQSEGMPMDKMLIGVPYYAREWPTASGTAPSSTTGNGVAYTWAKIRNNTSGNYLPENKNLEPNSFGPYYAYQDNGWYQCFVNDANSLKRRYKMTNHRGLAGIGIWALGYDNGYTDLWEVIAESFTQGPQITLYDTLYDSGGPSWNYYDDEEYVLTMHGLNDEALRLEFTDFSLENGYDSLWVYDGYYPGGYLIGGFTGSDLPPPVYAFDVLSIRFQSDHNTTEGGWTALVESFMISLDEPTISELGLSVYPNPVSSILNIESPDLKTGGHLRVYNLQRKLMLEQYIPQKTSKIRLDVTEFPGGIYFLTLSNGQSLIAQKKIIVN